MQTGFAAALLLIVAWAGVVATLRVAAWSHSTARRRKLLVKAEQKTARQRADVRRRRFAR
jgi:hypothetical protein